ncbi:STAS domain-containing protein [Lentzea sp. NPDC060358]|uniref:STAS domain-containing protein n=1 Tax=Lentzea sp. NPDC060358 TaxID=3347103 RepID=UPI00365056FB
MTRTTDAQGRSVVRVAGEIDLSNTDSFAAALEGTTGPLVVDLTEVLYIDSAGMSVLFAYADRAEIVATPLLAPIIEVSGLTSMATVRGMEG